MSTTPKVALGLVATAALGAVFFFGAAEPAAVESDQVAQRVHPDATPRARQSVSAAPARGEPSVASDAGLRAAPRDQLAGGGLAPKEQRELELMNELSDELEWTASQRAQVSAALEELQAGRRKLFEELAAHRIASGEVSNGLRSLRQQMSTRIVTTLGATRAAQFEERLRVAHGYQPVPSDEP